MADFGCGHKVAQVEIALIGPPGFNQEQAFCNAAAQRVLRAVSCAWGLRSLHCIRTDGSSNPCDRHADTHATYVRGEGGKEELGRVSPDFSHMLKEVSRSDLISFPVTPNGDHPAACCCRSAGAAAPLGGDWGTELMEVVHIH